MLERFFKNILDGFQNIPAENWIVREIDDAKAAYAFRISQDAISDCTNDLSLAIKRNEIVTVKGVFLKGRQFPIAPIIVIFIFFIVPSV